MRMKLLSSLFTATILIVTTSQAVLIEAGESVADDNMYIKIPQDAAIPITQPVTNTSTYCVIEDVHSTYDGSMNFTTSEDLDFQVNTDGMISTNAWEGHPNHDAADITIYDSYRHAQGLPNTDDLYSLELNDTVTISNESSTVTQLAVINGLSYGSDSPLVPSGNDSIFPSSSDRNRVSSRVSVSESPNKTRAGLASSGSSTFNISIFRDGRIPLLNHSPLNLSGETWFKR